MENKVEKRVSEMKEALMAAAKNSEDLLKRRAQIKEKISLWEKKREFYQAREQELLMQLATLKEQVSGSLIDGKDPEAIFREQRETSTKIEAMRDTFKKIERDILPNAHKELKQAEESVLNALRGDVGTVYSKCQEKLDKNTVDFIEVELLAWSQASGEFYQEMGVSGIHYRMRIKNRTIENAIL